MKEFMPYILIFLIIMIVYAILRSEPSNTYCKKFVITHRNEWISDPGKNKGFYWINHTDKKYYIDVTIKRLDNDAYTIVFWGDRRSLLWRFRLDKHFTVDASYRESKNQDVTLDRQIIQIIKNNEVIK